MKDIVTTRFDETLEIVRASRDLLSDKLVTAAEMIIEACSNGGGAYFFGNGGSASDAQHIACELVGRFLKERKALKAVALTTDTSILTCLSNDYSYDAIFERQIEAIATPGDVAVGLSTSGNSPNVVRALARAKEMGLKTIAFTGRGGGKCAELTDVLLDVPCDGPSCRIQESHQVMYHILCELVENAFAED